MIRGTGVWWRRPVILVAAIVILASALAVGLVLGLSNDQGAEHGLARPSVASGLSAASAPCTMYVSPTGSGNGSDTGHPASISYAETNDGPGDVVCLSGGTYNISSGSVNLNTSGTATSGIVWRGGAWGTGESIIRATYAHGNENDLVRITADYNQFENVTVDGNSLAMADITCQDSPTPKHVTIVDNKVMNSGGVGIRGHCEDLKILGNQIYHNGYFWTGTSSAAASGISFRTPSTTISMSGFHDVIAWNIISGEKENYASTDGNGIIRDIPDNTSTSVPALILGNVIYENRGRCIHTKNQTAQDWVVNNTCYKNALASDAPSPYGEYSAAGVTGGTNKFEHWINNLTEHFVETGGQARYNWSLINVAKLCPDSPSTYCSWQKNIGYPSGANGLPSLTSFEYQVANPQWTSGIAGVSEGDYVNAVAPWSLGDALTLSTGSPAIDAGIDPTTANGLSAGLATDMAQYLATDVAGNPRKVNGSYDIGAYEKQASAGGTVTSVNDTNASFAYAGGWTARTGQDTYLGDDHVSPNLGDVCTFSFSGTRAQVFATVGPGFGKADYRTDGGTPSTVDAYDPVRASETLLYDTGTLPAGSHTVSVTVLHTKNAGSSGYGVNADRIDVTG